MLAKSIYIPLLVAVTIAAAPIFRRNNVELMFLTNEADHPGNALSQGDIRIVKQLGPEALQAVKDTITVLSQPNFHTTGLYQVFLDHSDRVTMQQQVYQQLEQVLARSFPMRPEQEVSEMSQDPTHMTVMIDGPKGTAKASTGNPGGRDVDGNPSYMKLRPRFFGINPSEFITFEKALKMASEGESPLTQGKMIRVLTFIHELTHARNIMGAYRTTDVVNPATGSKAYGEASTTSLPDNLKTQNAQNIAFFLFYAVVLHRHGVDVCTLRGNPPTGGIHHTPRSLDELADMLNTISAPLYARGRSRAGSVSSEGKSHGHCIDVHNHISMAVFA